jgi:SAM-dependent methyltransferase
VKAEYAKHNEHRALLFSKPVLREVYSHLYRRIVGQLVPGAVIEVGGGSGNLKAFIPEMLSFDIAWTPWLDFVADAQRLPIADASVSNLVMLDVLHHIEFPRRFFAEAVRVLAPGGRVIMVEPGITPVSWFFYKFLHEEPTDMSVEPLPDGVPDSSIDPYFGNQGIPTVIFRRDAVAFRREFPGLRIVSIDWLSLFAYPLSGGFKPWTLLTPRLARALLKLEDAMAPAVRRWLGFRLAIVLEKHAPEMKAI